MRPLADIHLVNTMRPRQNGRLFADDTFKRIFLNESFRISIKTSLKFVPKGLIINIPALVLIMAWCRPGDKPLSEPMMVRSLTHICVTRPQWVNDSVPRWDEAIIGINGDFYSAQSPLWRSVVWQRNWGYIRTGPMHIKVVRVTARSRSCDMRF